MALAAPMGQVYAVECDADACALVRQNQAKFAASNLTLIAGKAPLKRCKICPRRMLFSSAAARAICRPL